MWRALFLSLWCVILIPPVVLPEVANWQRSIGSPNREEVRSLQQTLDGGYIAAGTISDLSDSADLWLMKFDASGNLAWQNKYAGSKNEQIAAVQQTRDRGYLLAGSTVSFGAGAADGFLMKLDEGGNIRWQKTYGGSGTDSFASVQVLADGGSIVVGNTEVTGNEDLWLMRLDGSGNIQWQKTYGGASADWGHSVQQTRDGGFIVGGSTGFMGPQSSDCWVLKLDAAGSVQWQKMFGGSSSDSVDSVQQTSDGGYFVHAVSLSFKNEIWLLKLDGSGNIRWQKTYGSGGEEMAYAARPTRDGGFILAGFLDARQMAPSLIKINGSGVVQWAKSYVIKYWGTLFAVQQAADSGYIAAGHSAESNGAPDALLLKVNPEGDVNGCAFDIQELEITTQNTSVKAANSVATVSNSTVTPQPGHAVMIRALPRMASSCGSRVVSIHPAAAPAGSTVTINGSGFGSADSDCHVMFGRMPADKTVSWSNTRIQVGVPASTVTGPVCIDTDATMGLSKEFVVTPTPPARMLPASGSSVGGTRVSILSPSTKGQNFTVQFGAATAPACRMVLPGVIVCTAPPGKAGPVNVTVKNPAGSENIGTYTYK